MILHPQCQAKELKVALRALGFEPKKEELKKLVWLELILLCHISIPSGNLSNMAGLAGKWTIEIGDFPMKTPIDKGFSIAMFDYQRVHIHVIGGLMGV